MIPYGKQTIDQDDIKTVLIPSLEIIIVVLFSLHDKSSLVENVVKEIK
jgi:hypothetical protein